MRRQIEPEQFKGTYREKIQEGDLLVMGTEPDTIKGRMPLREGIYDSLWELSLETDLGLIVDIRKIPLRQDIIDGCNAEDRDPYRIPLRDEIYIVRPESSYHLRDDLKVIGYLTSERVCRIKNKDRISYLNS